MFEYLTTYHYGRCVKGHDWYLKSIGINRLYRINAGELTVLLDNKPCTLVPGRVYLFPQNLKFEPVLNEKTWVDHTFLDFFTLPAIKMEGMVELDPEKSELLAPAARILFRLAEQFPTYPAMGSNGYTELVESYLENFLALTDKIHPIQRIEDPRINRALDYIHKNYASEITLDTLIGVTNLEKNYFIRLFKASMNVTPYQYIKKYRFNIALTLLKHRYSLNEAAAAVGYGDAASFSHAFKKIFGVPPSRITGRDGENGT